MVTVKFEEVVLDFSGWVTWKLFNDNYFTATYSTHTHTYTLTIHSWDDNGPHEYCIIGVGTLPVQSCSTGTDFPCTAVNGVERVFWADAVHHGAIFSIIRIHCQNLYREMSQKHKQMRSAKSKKTKQPKKKTIKPKPNNSWRKKKKQKEL